MRKVTLIGGGGIRTPLVIYGIAQAAQALNISEVALYDLDRERLALMATLSQEAARQLASPIKLTTHENLAPAVEDADFIIHSIRVGGIAARAHDERLAIEHGIAGQETTGLGGLAKALRTIPVVLDQAQVIAKHAPKAWFISFTNPAGLMTQALTTQTDLRVIGICDTPTEIFHRLAHGLDLPVAKLHCDYFGLNHLGWVRRVQADGEDVTTNVLANDQLLRSLYSADLFDPEMIRVMGMIPSEYLYFFYCQQRALTNQRAAGASRGEEVARLNDELFASLQTALHQDNSAEALEIYRSYLRRRSGSYLKLEAEAGSAMHDGMAQMEQEEDPFNAATGYHQIALKVMSALAHSQPQNIVLNVPNHGAISDLCDEDVVEVPCLVNLNGAKPLAIGKLPANVAGLVRMVKEYERLTIQAAVEGSATLAKQALLVYPLISQWDKADELINVLINSYPTSLSYLKS